MSHIQNKITRKEDKPDQPSDYYSTFQNKSVLTIPNS